MRILLTRLGEYIWDMLIDMNYLVKHISSCRALEETIIHKY